MRCTCTCELLSSRSTSLRNSISGKYICEKLEQTRCRRIPAKTAVPLKCNGQYRRVCLCWSFRRQMFERDVWIVARRRLSESRTERIVSPRLICVAFPGRSPKLKSSIKHLKLPVQKRNNVPGKKSQSFLKLCVHEIEVLNLPKPVSRLSSNCLLPVRSGFENKHVHKSNKNCKLWKSRKTSMFDSVCASTLIGDRDGMKKNYKIQNNRIVLGKASRSFSKRYC